MKRISKRKTKEQEQTTPYYTLVLIGDNNVGKTQILHRLNGEKFEEKYFPTFGVDFRIKKSLDEKGKHANDIQMIDVAGEKDTIHINIEKDFINIADAFLVVFDLSNEESVIKACDIKKEYSKKIDELPYKNSAAKWYLIGNKKDIGESGKRIPSQYKNRFDRYFEISSKTSISSEFENILDSIIKDLNNTVKENKNINNELENENEEFEEDFLKAHQDIFNDDCEIF